MEADIFGPELEYRQAYASIKEPHGLQMSESESMKRRYIAAMSLALITILQAAPAQVLARTARSQDNTNLVQRTEDKSGKPQAKDEGKKATASTVTKPVQPPKDITQSGKVFLDGCSSIDKPAKQLNSYETHTIVQCQSYVDGIFETMSLAENVHLKPRGFCAPEQPVQRNELVQIVRKYIADHPETSNERTVILAWLAFSQAFPCDKAKT